MFHDENIFFVGKNYLAKEKVSYCLLWGGFIRIDYIKDILCNILLRMHDLQNILQNGYVFDVGKHNCENKKIKKEGGLPPAVYFLRFV